ncbi:MAG: PIN domain-containing protein [Thermomicrobiales bacterium]
MSYFVDTNIFLRFLVGDDPDKARRSLALFRRAERGEIELVTSEVIVAEVVYVFSSRSVYQRTHAQVAEGLTPVIENRGLRIDHKLAVIAALERYAQTTHDFEDCLAAEHTVRQGLDGIYSFEKDQPFPRHPAPGAIGARTSPSHCDAGDQATGIADRSKYVLPSTQPSSAACSISSSETNGILR